MFMYIVATTTRRKMLCLVTAGKHVNDIRAIARQPPTTTIEKLLKAVFSVGSSPRLYNENLRPAELISQSSGVVREFYMRRCEDRT
jgi:hypothetical protein